MERSSSTHVTRPSRNLPHKQKGSRRHRIARRKVARLHLREANRRAAMLHEASQVLTRRLDTIVVEDLAMGSMAGNRRLSQVAMDCSRRGFRRRLDCNADLRGNPIFVARRLFASTKTCSRYGSATALRQCDPGFRPCRSSGAARDRHFSASRPRFLRPVARGAGWFRTRQRRQACRGMSCRLRPRCPQAARLRRCRRPAPGAS